MLTQSSEIYLWNVCCIIILSLSLIMPVPWSSFKGWLQQKSLSLHLSIHFIIAHSSSLSLPPSIFLNCSLLSSLILLGSFLLNTLQHSTMTLLLKCCYAKLLEATWAPCIQKPMCKQPSPGRYVKGVLLIMELRIGAATSISVHKEHVKRLWG